MVRSLVVALTPYDRVGGHCFALADSQPRRHQVHVGHNLPASFNVTSADGALGYRFAEDVHEQGSAEPVRIDQARGERAKSP